MSCVFWGGGGTADFCLCFPCVDRHNGRLLHVLLTKHDLRTSILNQTHFCSKAPERTSPSVTRIRLRNWTLSRLRCDGPGEPDTRFAVTLSTATLVFLSHALSVTRFAVTLSTAALVFLSHALGVSIFTGLHRAVLWGQKARAATSRTNRLESKVKDSTRLISARNFSTSSLYANSPRSRVHDSDTYLICSFVVTRPWGSLFVQRYVNLEPDPQGLDFGLLTKLGSACTESPKARFGDAVPICLFVAVPTVARVQRQFQHASKAS